MRAWLFLDHSAHSCQPRLTHHKRPLTRQPRAVETRNIDNFGRRCRRAAPRSRARCLSRSAVSTRASSPTIFRAPSRLPRQNLDTRTNFASHGARWLKLSGHASGGFVAGLRSRPMVHAGCQHLPTIFHRRDPCSPASIDKLRALSGLCAELPRQATARGAHSTFESKFPLKPSISSCQCQACAGHFEVPKCCLHV